MGCSSSKTNDPLNNENPNRTGLNIPFNEVIVNSEYRFRDFPDTDDDTFIGNGIKRIHNYKCDLPYDKLNYLRQQFWLTRNQSDDNWLILRTCCLNDEIYAKQLLDANHLICIEGNIQKCYSLAQPSFIYRIPNFCIADPIFENNYDNLERMYDDVEDNNINIVIDYTNQNQKYDLKIRNKSTGYDLKYKIRKRLGIDTIKNEMVLLFKGNEILDYNCMYYYKVDDGAVITLITRLKEEKDDNRILKKQERREVQINSYKKPISDISVTVFNNNRVDYDMEVGSKDNFEGSIKSMEKSKKSFRLSHNNKSVKSSEIRSNESEEDSNL